MFISESFTLEYIDLTNSMRYIPRPSKYDNPDFRWLVTTMCGSQDCENRDDIEFLSGLPNINRYLVENHILSTAQKADEEGGCNC